MSDEQQQDSSDGLKLFFAVPVSLSGVRKVSSAAEELRTACANPKAMRWVAPARYHVTLKFLGWCKAEALEAIRDAADQVMSQATSFEIVCEGMGAFPSESEARVLWAGIKDESGQLAALAGALDEAMGELGFATETRPYRPHLTVARCRPPQDVEKALQRFTGRLFSKSSPKSLILYKSNVESGSSEYEKIASWAIE